jgi:hypothetical protein
MAEVSSDHYFWKVKNPSSGVKIALATILHWGFEVGCYILSQKADLLVCESRFRVWVVVLELNCLLNWYY